LCQLLCLFQTLIYAWIDTLLIIIHLQHFEITTVLFYSKGSVDVSVDVKYELAVKKAAASSTVKIIVETVKETSENGTFGKFAIDLTSIKGESEL